MVGEWGVDKTLTRKMMQGLASMGPAVCLFALAADQGARLVDCFETCCLCGHTNMPCAIGAMPPLGQSFIIQLLAPAAWRNRLAGRQSLTLCRHAACRQGPQHGGERGAAVGNAGAGRLPVRGPGQQPPGITSLVHLPRSSGGPRCSRRSEYYSVQQQTHICVAT